MLRSQRSPISRTTAQCHAGRRRIGPNSQPGRSTASRTTGQSSIWAWILLLLTAIGSVPRASLADGVLIVLPNETREDNTIPCDDSRDADGLLFLRHAPTYLDNAHQTNEWMRRYAIRRNVAAGLAELATAIGDGSAIPFDAAFITVSAPDAIVDIRPEQLAIVYFHDPLGDAFADRVTLELDPGLRFIRVNSSGTLHVLGSSYSFMPKRYAAEAFTLYGYNGRDELTTSKRYLGVNPLDRDRRRR